MNTDTKQCSKCKLVKARFEFGKSRRGDGRYQHCRQCVRDYNTACGRTSVWSPEEIAAVKNVQSKTCTKCNITQDRSEFHVSPAMQDGLRNECRSCMKLRSKNWNMKQKYGLTVDAIESMRQAQNNRCKLCGSVFQADDKPHVDHCHRTGRVRGVLHSKCNGLLGMADDNIELLQQAIAYLKESR